MDVDVEYALDLARICDGYHEGLLTHDEFLQEMAALRDKRIERRKDPERQKRPPESPQGDGRGGPLLTPCLGEIVGLRGH